MNKFNITVQLSLDPLFHNTINPQRRRQFLYYSVEHIRNFWLSTCTQIYPGSWSSGLYVYTPCRRQRFPFQQIGVWNVIRHEHFCVVLWSGCTSIPTIIFDRQWGLASTSGVKPWQIKPCKQGWIFFLLSLLPCYSVPFPPFQGF